jgi:hypothetical protein
MSVSGAEAEQTENHRKNESEMKPLNKPQPNPWKWIGITLVTSALLGFATAVCIHLAIPHEAPSDELLATGFGVSILWFAVIWYALCVLICALKDKWVFFALGLVAILLTLGSVSNPVGRPGVFVSFFPIIGAIRLAKPNSSWAKKYYGDVKMGIAARRFIRTADG